MMARDKTDRPWQADLLAKLLKGRPAHVNLIPLNEWRKSLKPSRPETVRRFQQRSRSAALPRPCGASWVRILMRPAVSSVSDS